MKYASLLKAKLQQICQERGLSTEGTKDVLIERLEENDTLRAELEGPADEDAAAAASADAEEKAEEKPEEAAAPAEPAAGASAAETAAETAPEPAEAVSDAVPDAVPEAPAVSEEELKAQTIADLTKRAARARRFGDDDAASQLEAQLARIEKFGLSALPQPAKNTPAKPKYRHAGVAKGFRSRHRK